MNNRKKEIVTLHNQGYTKKEICNIANLSRSQVCRYLKNIAIPEKSGPPKEGKTEKEVIKLLKAGKTVKEVSTQLSISTSTIYKFSSKYKIGLKTGIQPKVASEVLVEMYKTKDCPQIGKELKLDAKTVFYHINKHSTLRKPGTRIKISGELNKEAFDLNNISKENMYWLGFLFGDGCISGKKLYLGLKSSDEYHVLAFKDFLKYKGKLGRYKFKSPYFQKTGTTCFRSAFSITSPTIVNDLINNFSLLQNKSRVGGYSKKYSRKFTK